MKLLDTSVVVDIDRGGVDERVAKLDNVGRHALSVVTLTVLRWGVDKRYEIGTDAHDDALEGLERLLARFDILAVTRPVAAMAADIIADLQARGLPLTDLHDVYIGATGRIGQLPVLTAHVADFDRIEDIRVVDWEAY